LSLKIYSDNVLRLKDLVFNKKKIDYDCRVLYTLVFVLKIPFIFFNTHVIPKKTSSSISFFMNIEWKKYIFSCNFFMKLLHDLITFFFSHLQNIKMFFFNSQSFFIIKTILTIKINIFSMKQSKDMLIKKRSRLKKYISHR